MPLQRWSEAIWLAQMSPEPTFSEEVDSLLSQYAKTKTPPAVVVDLAALPIINSTTLSQLLRVRQAVHARGQRLKVASPTDAVWSVFLTASLDKVFEFSPDTMTALAHLQLNG